MTLMKKRMLMLVAAVLGIGVGIALFLRSGLGNDPCSAMNLAIAAKTGITFGNIVLISNLVMFVAVLIFRRQSIGVGTLINMVLVGYIADFFAGIMAKRLPSPDTLPVQLAYVVAGILILSLGASLYFTAALGIAPYDTMAFIIEDHTPLPFAWCRILTDCICTIVAVALGGLVGIGTLVTAFCLGPFINFFNDKVSIPLLGGHRVTSKTAQENKIA